MEPRCSSPFAQRFVSLIILGAGLVLAQPSDRRPDIRAGHFRGVPVIFENQHGFAVVEGDIILGTTEELMKAPSTKRGGSVSASVINGDRYRWPERKIPYVIDPEIPNPQRIHEAIEVWQRLTPIRLVERGEESDYVRFTPQPSGCTANVGRITGLQRVNVGAECTRIALVHEIGHAVGLWHTQSRADRNEYVRIEYSSIDKTYWSAFDQHLHDGDDLGPYDYSSIMHYSSRGFLRDFGLSINTIPQGIPIGQQSELSPGDIESVIRLYGGRPEAITVATNPPGLPLVVDGVELTSPRTFQWAPGEKHVISVPELVTTGPTTRARFARWSSGIAREQELEVSESVSTYTAHFREEYLIRTAASPAGGGSVRTIPDSPDGYHPVNSLVEFVATPATGFSFLSWSAGAGGVTVLAANGQGASSNPVAAAVTFNNLFYTANFTSSPLTTITSDPAGRTVTVDGVSTITPRSFAWAPGSSHTLTVTSQQTGPGGVARYRFQSWSNGGQPAQTITAANEPITVTARFQTQFRVGTTIIPYLLVTSDRAGSDNLIVEPSSPDGFHDAGSAVQFQASGGNGFRFSNWSGDLSGSAPSRQMTVREQTHVTATYLSPLLIWNSSVVHGATKQPSPIAPGQEVVIYSPEIGPEGDTEHQFDESGALLLTVAGRTVLFDGVAAPILRAGRDQITVIAPTSIAGKVRTVLSVEGASYNFPRPLGVAPSVPGIYTRDGSGRGQATALNEDLTENSIAQPAYRNTPVTFRLTGAGLFDPPLAEGAIRPEPGARPALPVAVWIGGRQAEVVFARYEPGLTAGVILVRAVIPPDTQPGEEVPLTVQIGAARSQDKITISVAR